MTPETIQKTALDSINETTQETAQALLAILPRINRIMVSELRHEAGEDTTMPQFRVLAYLLESPRTPSDIARLRHVSLQAAGILIQSLVERGWVERMPDPYDRRQTYLHLTEVGREQYERAYNRMLSHMIPFMEQLNQEELAAVQVALHALERVLSGDASHDNE